MLLCVLVCGALPLLTLFVVLQPHWYWKNYVIVSPLASPLLPPPQITLFFVCSKPSYYHSTSTLSASRAPTSRFVCRACWMFDVLSVRELVFSTDTRFWLVMAISMSPMPTPVTNHLLLLCAGWLASPPFYCSDVVAL
uniref:Secreted peptide n=1 Tax=Trypanosoma vivax (strain Y486) TaxID=1055687 RepID=G0U2H2_TRYVY|nr:hypothetical protein TVY486_0902960 [Trypanosoma vivax Y486]